MRPSSRTATQFTAGGGSKIYSNREKRRRSRERWIPQQAWRVIFGKREEAGVFGL